MEKGWIRRCRQMERERDREWWLRIDEPLTRGLGQTASGQRPAMSYRHFTVPHCKKVSRVGMHTFVHAVLTSYRFLDHMLCPFLSNELSCHGTSRTGPDRLSSEARAPSARLWIWPSWTHRKPKVLVSMSVMTRNTLWTRSRCRSSLQCMQWLCNRHLCVAWQLDHWSASDVHSRCVLVLP